MRGQDGHRTPAPVILDVEGRDIHGEGAVLRALEPGELRPIRSMLSNGHVRLPVRR